MAEAGYSGTPLARKLGYKPHFRCYVEDAPASHRATIAQEAAHLEVPDDLDLAHLFTDTRAVLEERFPVLRDALRPAGMLWVSWPKKASKVPTDLTGDVVRELGLAMGLVDVKVCAVDDVWSGLKFVRRLAER
ncbi:MAG: DUF3052 domain-containing protein [Thermoplasmatota archaeon]